MKKSELLPHAQVYIREVMSDLLRSEGFISRDGDDIQWYRVINNEIVQSVFFYTTGLHLPVELKIGFAAHPLYIRPFFYKGVLISGPDGYEDYERINEYARLLASQQLIGFQDKKTGEYVARDTTIENLLEGGYINEAFRNRYSDFIETRKQVGDIFGARPDFKPGIWVYYPPSEDKGRFLLESILRILNRIKSPEACYQFHTAFQFPSSPQHVGMNRVGSFTREVFFLGKEEHYDYCRKSIEKRLENNERLKNVKMQAKLRQTETEELMQLKGLVFNEDREAFMAFLEEEKKQTIKMLLKHTGIVINMD